MDSFWLLAYLLLGGITGVLAGLFGIGGGGVMVPVLTMLFVAQQFPAEHLVHLALGTSMAAIVPTACASLYAHHGHQAVLWPTVIKITPGVLLGTFGATFVASWLSPLFLALFFTAFMSFVALQLLLNRTPSPSRGLPGVLGLSSAGIGIGGISALVAIGGGTMTVPFLTWCNQRLPVAIGTSAAVGLPIALAGAVGYLVNGWSATDLPEYSLGYVYWPAVVAMATASLFTARIGASLAHKLPVKLLRKLFALVLVILAVQMLLTLN